MNRISADQVRSFVLSQLEESLVSKKLAPRDLPHDFDLLAQGVIDSFGLVELIAAVEEEFGIEVDFEDLDVEDLTVIGPLSQYIAAKGAQANTGTP